MTNAVRLITRRRNGAVYRCGVWRFAHAWLRRGWTFLYRVRVSVDV